MLTEIILFLILILTPKSTSLVTTQTNFEEKYPPLSTIDQIFQKNHLPVNSNEIITIIATGDVIPARSVNYQATIRNDFTWPFLKTHQFLKDADLTFINLETPLINSCPLTQEGMIFCGNSKNIEGLSLSGVDVANLANNHSSNYGTKAIDETIEHLEKAGIATTGHLKSNILIKEIKGIKFAFLGFNDIDYKHEAVSRAEEEKIKQDVAEARKKADVVVVTYHWGVEYRSQPDDRQKYLGRFTIDIGADLVIGNHPHWIQPVEIYKGKLITYAHGNFVFDQEWSQKTKEGVVGRYTFYGKDLIDVEYFPIQIDNYGQPHFLEGEQKEKILDEMYTESMKLAGSNLKK